MASKRATLADVARLAGLSPTTASLILNGKPNTRFSADAHRRVHDAVAQLGYRPNMGARALRTDRSLTIGFISDVVATTRFASGLIRGALEQAQTAGHLLLVVETGDDVDREVEAVGAVLDRQVDGIIFATMRARELFVPPIPDSTRVVILNATSAQFGLSVLPDEEQGGRRAVDLLVAAGHTDDIALIGQSDDVEGDLFRSATVARRVQGLRSELADFGLRFVAEESCWEWEPEDGYRLAASLLDRRDDIRALLCMNDRLAFGAYQACQERGLTVGRDISIASFDNDELAAYLRPGLTTVGLPHEAMGRAAVELLLSDATPGERLIKMPVVKRASIVEGERRSPLMQLASERLAAYDSD
ncbi:MULTISPECIES: LacI family DNA-binding transcriptional regulator [Subtercola]|uniref:LacI family DNA-binding transcriptional regulator n=1 Tax=Subtercola vilae TaxID=2056433 RepID=A0A4T2BU37_9MICO|nr:MULTISPECIES: LacI family DNA-binding transcriptional regulator [Subtercola]MEA9985625.1 LacI family DNA-binding transcriptional regulator [Subtercola sp. RTI3]TIH34850.1 LacI family DNA-binding transcriptional regulator [Subtercola vilae]